MLSFLFAGAGFFVKLIFFTPFSSVLSLGIDIFRKPRNAVRCELPPARGTPQAVAKCAWPWLFVLAVAVCSFLLKMSKILG